jgi:hypothetical protein
VDVGTAFVAGAQAFEGVEPGEAAFDGPAASAQTGSVRYAAARDAWSDAAVAEQTAVLVAVVAAVGEQLARLAPRSAAAAADRRNRIEQRQ